MLLVDRSHLTIVFAVFVSLAAGCQETWRIPRIEPELSGWTVPYAGVEGMRVHVFDTGTMELPEGVLFRGGSWLRPRQLAALAFVIEHPEKGLVVFDTGLAGALEEDREAYLGGLMAAIAEISLAEAGTLGQQMAAAGLDPAAVTHVVLSHMHFDHTGGLESFANAEVVVARKELAGAHARQWPLDYFIEEDWDGVGVWFEVDYDSKPPLATFTAHHDLLGDGSILLVDLSGHTAGSQGLVAMLAAGPVLLTGDASWVEENWRYAARPLMAHDMRGWWEQIWRIKKFVQLVPAAVVIAGHDLGQAAEVGRGDLVLH